MTTRRTKSPGRKRRTLGWTLAVVGLLIAGVWFASGWVPVMYVGTQGHAAIGGGAISFALENNTWIHGSGWQVMPTEKNERHWSWWMHSTIVSKYSSSTSFGLYERIDIGISPKTNIHTLLLWPFPILCWVPAYFLLRSGYRVRRLALGGAA